MMGELLTKPISVTSTLKELRDNKGHGFKKRSLIFVVGLGLGKVSVMKPCMK